MRPLSCYLTLHMFLLSLLVRYTNTVLLRVSQEAEVSVLQGEEKLWFLLVPQVQLQHTEMYESITALLELLSAGTQNMVNLWHSKTHTFPYGFHFTSKLVNKQQLEG